MYQLALFLSIIATGLASDVTPLIKCKNFDGKLLKKVVIRNQNEVCTKLPCILKAGTNVTSDVTFETKSDIQKIILKMNVTINGIVIDYPLPDEDKACKWLTKSSCPIKKGTEANLHYVFPVKKIFSYPTLVTPYLLDQRNKIIFCFEVPVKIV